MTIFVSWGSWSLTARNSALSALPPSVDTRRNVETFISNTFPWSWPSPSNQRPTWICKPLIFVINIYIVNSAILKWVFSRVIKTLPLSTWFLALTPLWLQIPANANGARQQGWLSCWVLDMHLGDIDCVTDSQLLVSVQPSLLQEAWHELEGGSSVCLPVS